MVAPSAFASSKSYVEFTPELVRGTAQAVDSTTEAVPVVAPKWEPKINWLPDKGMRGSPVDVYDEVAGGRHDEWTAKSAIYPDTFPFLAVAALGSADVVSGSGPYLHTIGLKRSGDTQPRSYTIDAFDGQATRQLAGGQLSKIDFNWTAEGAMDIDMLWLGNAATYEAESTPTYSTQRMVPGWDVGMTITNNNTSATVISDLTGGSLSIDRKAAAIMIAGQQSSFQNWAESISVTGKFMCVVQNSDEVLADSLASVSTTVTLTFTDPDTVYYGSFVMSKVQLMNPIIDQSKSYLEIDCNFEAVGNTVDAVDTGYSPIKFIGSNGVSTAYNS